MEKGASEKKKKPSLLDSLLQRCHSHRRILRMPGQSELEAEEGRGGGTFTALPLSQMCESGSTETH